MSTIYSGKMLERNVSMNLIIIFMASDKKRSDVFYVVSLRCHSGSVVEVAKISELNSMIWTGQKIKHVEILKQ